MTVRVMSGVPAAGAAACLVAAMLAGAGPASAADRPTSAAPAANSGARVAGASGVPAAGNGGKDCAYGDLCLYTGTNYTGTRFSLYACRDWALSGWDGRGSYDNNQTSGTMSRFEYANDNWFYESFAPDWNASFDYYPAYYVRNC